MRIVFTGGSGKAGRHVVPWLRDKGHEILNVDLKPLDCPGVNTLMADVTDSGQVFNALSMHFGFDGYETGNGPAKVDAVVHFAAVPRVLIVPDNTTFSANVVSTYNVIEAAVKLGYVSEANSDPCFPYPQIAAQIAERAGLQVQHRGNVRRSLQKKFLGLNRDFLSESVGEVPEAEIEALNASHRRWVTRLIGLFVGLVIVGIALDIAFPPSSGLPPALTSVTKSIMGSMAPGPADQPGAKK